jgi:hypothetical protein
LSQAASPAEQAKQVSRLCALIPYPRVKFTASSG